MSVLLVGVLDSGPPLSPDSENCIGNIHPREIYPVIDHVEARIYDILDSVFSPLNLQVKASRKIVLLRGKLRNVKMKSKNELVPVQRNDCKIMTFFDSTLEITGNSHIFQNEDPPDDVENDSVSNAQEGNTRDASQETSDPAK